jgi:hypothetical protein
MLRAFRSPGSNLYRCFFSTCSCIISIKVPWHAGLMGSSEAMVRSHSMDLGLLCSSTSCRCGDSTWPEQLESACSSGIWSLTTRRRRTVPGPRTPIRRPRMHGVCSCGELTAAWPNTGLWSAAATTSPPFLFVDAAQDVKTQSSNCTRNRRNQLARSDR